MIEQQVEVEFTVADDQFILTTDKRKAASEFQQELFDMRQETCFEFSFMERFLQREEVEQVGIFQQAGGEFGMDGWQAMTEVADRRPCRLWAADLILELRTSRLQPFSAVWRAYQKRVGKSLIFSISR